MKHFIVETNEGQSGSDYANDDDFVPPTHPTHPTHPTPPSVDILLPSCQYTAECTNTKSNYYCKKNDLEQCARPVEECKCKKGSKGCNTCLLVSCMKKKMGCKLGEGKPGELCAIPG